MATTLKVRIRTQLPAAVIDGAGIEITKNGLSYTFGFDYSQFALITSYDPSAKQIVVEDTTDGSFNLVTITQLLTGSQTQQIKTSAGDVNVAITDGAIVVNKTVGAATAVNLPAASSKVGPVAVIDWKGDAGTNNITVNVAGADKLNGNRTTYVIAANGAALVFVPISDGSGYAVQNIGTVSAHAIPIGQGAGFQGLKSLTLTDGQLIIGQTGADPQAITLSGDITVSAAGVTAIGSGKVVAAMVASNAIATANIIAANVTNAKLANMAAFSLKGNSTGSSAVPTDIDISALTTKASPAAGDYVVISDQAASGALKKATVSSVGSAGSVASVNGQTGAIVSYFEPQGRLTLVTATPVMVTTQSAKTTIYYTPYHGNMVPIYDGTNMAPTAVAEISQTTADTTKNPAAIGASKVNDWFVWNDSGTIRLSHGPDWTNDTTRSAGTALTMVSGILLNNAIITNGPAASRGTYVGTTRSNGSSQFDWIYGASASGGTAAFLGVWNAYNRVSVPTTVTDSGTAYTYTTATIRQQRASAGMQVAFIRGLDEETADLKSNTDSTGVAIGASVIFGIGLDSTSAFTSSASTAYMQTQVASTANIYLTAFYAGYPGLGFHTLAALEKGDGTNANLINNGHAAGVDNNLQFSMRM